MTNPIKKMLNQSLEEEHPAAEIQLWPDIRRALAGENPDRSPKRTPGTIRRRLALASATALVLLTAVLITPGGRALAQSLVNFFTRTESTAFSLEAEQIPDPGAELAPEAQAPAPYLSLEEAEDQAGFQAAALPEVPEGFSYLGARSSGQQITSHYQAQGMGGGLTITQSRDGYSESDWDQVPGEAVVPVQVRGSEGEFVQGAFVVFPGEEDAAWNPEMPLLRLRWQEGGFWMEISKQGNVESIEYLDREGLIDLAETLTFGE